jgi:hypothetical protein
MFRKDNNWCYERYNYSFLDSEKQDFCKRLGELEVGSRNYIEENTEAIEKERLILKTNQEKEAEKMAQRAAPKTKGKKDKRVKKQEIEKKATEEVDEEEKEKRDREERNKNPEFMPGFRGHVSHL